MAESFLLAAAGAGLGLLLSHSLGKFLVSLISTERNRAFVDLAPDWRVLGFTLGLPDSRPASSSDSLPPCATQPFLLKR